MKRSLAPKEHGAYAQLGLPLATALIAGRPSFSAVALTLSAVAAFFAHEPVLVLLGRRGARAARDEGPRARRYAAALLLLAAALGGFGLFVGGRAVLTAALLPALMFVGVVGLVARDQERSTPGESFIAACLAAAALPVAIASGWQLRDALGAMIAWSISMAAATVAVRGILAAKKRGTPPSRTAALVAIAPLGAVIPTLLGAIPWWAVAASFPIVLVAMVIALKPPHPRALHTVGWALVAATVATGAAIALGVQG